MDVVRVDTGNYGPKELVQGYDDFIWTERYGPCGDFKMVTKRIDQHRAQLPVGQILANVDSEEMCWVENHVIQPSGDAEYVGEVLEITGRTFEAPLLAGRSYFEGFTVGLLDSSWKWSQVLQFLLNQPLTNYAMGTNKAYVADLVVQNGVTVEPAGPGVYYPADLSDIFSSRDIYTIVQDIVSRGRFGFKAVRPGLGGGDVTLRSYNGASKTESDATKVIFDYQDGDLVSPKFLESNADYYTAALVHSSAGWISVDAPWLSAPPQYGVGRRVLTVEANDIEFTTSADWTWRMQQRGITELNKHKQRTLFAAGVTTNAKYKYGQHYFLGDTVTLKGKYGTQNMIVTEFIRTDDKEGDRGYPTLMLPEVT